jgi:uncharacterized membrane protein YeiB
MPLYVDAVPIGASLAPGSGATGRTVPVGRLGALDVLRGIAICGILLMHIWKVGEVRLYR